MFWTLDMEFISWMMQDFLYIYLWKYQKYFLCKEKNSISNEKTINSMYYI